MTKPFTSLRSPNAFGTTQTHRTFVRITAPAASGKANKATIEVLAGFFGVKKRVIRIIRGKKSREKIIDVSLRYALAGNITEDKRLQRILKKKRKHRKTSQKYIKNGMRSKSKFS
ncbi:MAG: DUF167 domain-containing protein [Methanophagales archaeon]|nr:DUF167 domain-containing protein [Methanophagales archaeon]